MARLQVKFWLDSHKSLEAELYDALQALKDHRQFTATIRNALRLLLDLRARKVDVLLELFPWVAEYFKPQMIEIPKPALSVTEMNQLAQFLLERSTGINQPSAVGYQEQRRIAISATDRDDLLGDLEISQAKSDENATYNMVLSSLGMGIIRLEEVKSEVIAYGLQKDRIPARLKAQAKAQLDRKSEKSTPQGPKAMKVPQFAPPAIDLDADLLMSTT